MQNASKSPHTSSKESANGKAAPAAPGNSDAINAIDLLEADHREVEAMFEEFASSDDDEHKEGLADDICLALSVHAQIEEEIFYPAFLDATDEEDIHHEAVVEHDGVKDLIAKIENSDADSEYFDARMTVLSEMVKHHVQEEEQAGGMFDEAQKSDMDLEALGAQMQARKLQLLQEADADDGDNESSGADDDSEGASSSARTS